MKREKLIGIKVSQVERDQLERRAAKSNKKFSDYLRGVLFDNDQKRLERIEFAISELRKESNDLVKKQNEGLHQGKKNFRLQVFLAQSIFNLGYLATNLINLFTFTFAKQIPEHVERPSEERKNSYIKEKFDQMKSDLEEVQ